MTLFMIDLCSGLGGASEAMYQSKDWEVLRIDSDPLGILKEVGIPCTEERRIEDIDWKLPRRLDLLWASPPCREFSFGYSSPKSKAIRNGEGEEYEPDMSILENVIRLRDFWEPKFWCVENVIGSIPHFKPYLGEPTQIIGPFVLWHNLPHIAVSRNFSHSKAENDTWSDDPLRPNRRAKIPIELSRAVMQSAMCPTLGEWS
jgi:hypothetical protein